MKILLTTLNSQYVHSNPALRYLYTVAVNEKADLELREFTINNEPNYIYAELVRANYDMVCFSCYLWNIDPIIRLARNLKKARPEIRILLGGPEVSYHAPEFMRENSWCDYIIAGEGEYSFYRLVQTMTGVRLTGSLEEELSTIPGLVYRAQGRIFVNGQADLMDFNAIPFLYSVLEPENDKVVYYESSRGCPYRCTYCMSSIEKTVRALDTVRVKRELSYFLYRKVPQVKFIDRTFNYDRERAKEILSYLIDNDNGVTSFHFELCADLLDTDTLKVMKRARKGLFELEIGIQSVNPKTLETVERNDNIYRVLYNTGKLIELGNCHTHVDLIAGLPCEDYESFGRSFDRVYALKADAFQMGFLKVLQGTALYDSAERYGIVYREEPPYEVISTDCITPEEMVRLKMIEKMLNIYYNRGGYANTLDYLIPAVSDAVRIRREGQKNDSKEDSAFAFYERLAGFYYDRGFQHRDRKKEDQYRILYAFGKFLEETGVLSDAGEKTLACLTRDAEENMDAINLKRFLNKGWEME